MMLYILYCDSLAHDNSSHIAGDVGDIENVKLTLVCSGFGVLGIGTY